MTPKLQPAHLSFSSLNESASCRRGWFSRRILGRQAPAGDAANFGKRFEDRVTALLGAIPAVSARRPAKSEPAPGVEQALPAKEAFAAFEKAEDRLQDELARGTAVYLGTPGALVPMSKAEPTREIISQGEVWLEPGQWGVLADHYGVRSDIHIPFLGYIDFLERSGAGMRKKIVDIKTSSRKGWQVQWALQTTLYALFERAQTCEIHLTVRPSPKLDENGDPVQSKRPAQFRSFIYQFSPTDETFAWAMQWVGTHARTIREDTDAPCLEALPATPTYACAWCNENAACEAYRLSKLTCLGGEVDE